MSNSIQATRTANGKIGELLGELELTANGWHVERLDGSSHAANGDLIAIKGNQRCAIQVKTNGSQSDRATLGHATSFLKEGSAFFNSKNAPIMIDVVVSVTFLPDFRTPVFHVFTVAEAEAVARKHAEEWYATPKRNGERRSINFSVPPLFAEVMKYRDAWSKLDNQ